MAKKRGGGTSKSELIRTANAENPTAGPTEIARMILANHNQKVSPAMVSTVLSQDRNRGGSAPAKRGRPPKDANATASASAKPGRKAAPTSSSKSSGMSVETLLRVKKLADEMGGIGEAKKALDALTQILG